MTRKEIVDALIGLITVVLLWAGFWMYLACTPDQSSGEAEWQNACEQAAESAND